MPPICDGNSAGALSTSSRRCRKGAGLVETQKFLGRTPEDNQAWDEVQAYLKKNPTGFLGGPVPDLPPGAAMEDLNPPPTFLASLDAPMDGFATDSAAFFGNGGVGRPSGLSTKLNGDLGSTGPASALLLERHLTLRPQESRTLCFLYGYAPQGFQIGDLVSKYSVDPAVCVGALQCSLEKRWTPIHRSRRALGGKGNLLA